MADYVSKYTGSEVDGILDEAIELPQSSYADEGKVLIINSTGEPVWADKINIDTSLKDIEGFSANKYLRAVGGTAVPEWADWDIPDYSGVGQGSILTVENCWNGENKLVWNDTYITANDGQYLKYSSNTGIIWSSIYSSIPEYDDGDAGKVLTVHGTDDDLVWSYPIDISDASDGDFLKYSENRGIIWDEPIDTSFASNGDCLKYSNDSGYYWTEPISTTNASDGQFLKYSSDHGVIWDNPIDTTNASDGQFLRYSNDTGMMWDNVPGIDTSNAQNGQSLKYSSDTGMMWETLPVFPSGAIDGSILTYNEEYNCLTWAADSGNEGQVLTYAKRVGGSGYTVEWADVDRFPVYDTSNPSSDAGKVLTVLDNGTLGWVLPNQ